MADPVSSSSNKPNRPTYSCVRCADRKVKCDRQRPCGACVKHNVDCVFNSSYSHRKSRKRYKEQVLADRLKRYEIILQEQGIDPSKLPSTISAEPSGDPSQILSVGIKEAQYPTPSSVESGPDQSINNTQLVVGQGRSKFVDNTLWSRVVEELPNPEDALEHSSSETADEETSDDDFPLVLGPQLRSTIRLHHPPPERIHELWQIFVERFDPLTKIVHVPTLYPAVQKAASDTTTIPRTFEPLMFAIYGAAVMTLSDKECLDRFNMSRKPLLSRYVSAAKEALSQAKFMGTSSLVVLQALIIYLVSIRAIYEPRTIWNLTGVAVRIAQGMGLERDGLTLGLSPFETELRRRIWWMLRTHDFRTAELCGLSKFRDLDVDPQRTQWPTNVDDNQLYPGMSSLPATLDGLTDMVFVALIYDLTNFASGRIARFREQGKSSSHWELNQSGTDKEEIYEAFKVLQHDIEMKYLRHCDPSQPLQLLTMLIARGAQNMFHFLVHHPRRWTSLEETPISEREWVWSLSIKLLEQQDMIASNSQIMRYAWHSGYYLPWHAIIHVLDTLQANPIIADAEKIWQLIGRTYENNPDLILNTKKPIHVAVGNLCLKAYSAREAALQHINMHSPSRPGFIIQLRQQRETAKNKRRARGVKSGIVLNPASNGRTNTEMASSKQDDDPTLSSNGQDPVNSQPDPTTNTSNPMQTGGNMDTDPFWLMNGFDHNQPSDFHDMLNMDPDYILAQGNNTEDGSAYTVPWEQWDAWLADSNAMRPLSSSWDFGGDP